MTDSSSPGDVTLLLNKLAQGDSGVLDELFTAVYAELRRIARSQRRRNSAQSTLDYTALLHEAYLRFAKAGQQDFEHRQHFYAVAARAMRQILVDAARKRKAHKRGGEVEFVPLLNNDSNEAKLDQQADFLIALDQGLEHLGKTRQRARQVVELRFFCGFTEEETADLLAVDQRTVRRDWAMARVWLATELNLERQTLNSANRL